MSTTREKYLEWKARCSIVELPIEIWAEIFSFLSVKDLFAVRLVSRRFNNCVNEQTQFWSSVIVDLENCPSFKIHQSRLTSIRLSKVDLLMKTKVYRHCDVHLRSQITENSTSKRKLRSMNFADDSSERIFLRCSSIYFRSLKFWKSEQLELMLKKSLRKLSFGYEFSSREASLNFLFNLDRLKYLKIHFVHAINHINDFSTMLINTMQQVICSVVRLSRLKSLTLQNLYLSQKIPEKTLFTIDKIRFLWLENCKNIHFLLSIIDKHQLKCVVIRNSTCQSKTLLNFLSRLNSATHLDLGSIETSSPISTNEKIDFPANLKVARFNPSSLNLFSTRVNDSIRSLELVDVGLEQFTEIVQQCSSLQIVCLFFIRFPPSKFVKYFQKNPIGKLKIHFHLDEKFNLIDLPVDFLVLSNEKFSRCYQFENLIKQNLSIER